MLLDDIIASLKQHESLLRSHGVRHAAVFGSQARGDAGPSSDIDIGLRLDPEAPIGIYEYVGIKELVAGLFEGPVDVVNLDAMRARSREHALKDAVFAF